MSTPKDDSELGSNARDYVVSATKAMAGAVPFAGSLLAEIAGVVIPNQRMDRIVKFAQTLQDRLSSVEQDFIKSQINNENFTDLMEEGLRQAARSTSDERREYIASLIANSLTSDQISYVEAKHLLRILGEINDIEMIRLALRRFQTSNQGRDEYWKKHEDVLRPINASFGDPIEIIEKGHMQESYDEHLVQLGLLREHYGSDHRTHQPVFDHDGRQKVQYLSLSSTGRLLLKHVGAWKD